MKSVSCSLTVVYKRMVYDVKGNGYANEATLKLFLFLFRKEVHSKRKEFAPKELLLLGRGLVRIKADRK